MTSRNRSAAHSELKQRTLLAIGARDDVLVWNAPAGLFRTLDGRGTVRVGLTGQADLLGVWLHPVHGIGQAVAFETKTGEGRLSREQKLWRNQFEARGGLYVQVRDPQDAIKALEGGSGRTACMGDLLLSGTGPAADEDRPVYLDEAVSGLTDEELVKLYEACCTEMSRRGLGSC